MAEAFDGADKIIKNSKAKPKDDLTKSNININVKVPQPQSDKQISSINKQLKDIKRQAQLEKQQGISRKIRSGVSRAITALAENKMSPQEKEARRMAQVQRSRFEQMQRMGAIQASEDGFDNKFERQLVANKLKLDAEEARRRFHEIPKDFLLRRAMLRDLQLQRQRDWGKRNNMFREHQRGVKVRLNLLNVDEHTNLMSTPLIWREDNPDNNIFQDNGRPNILDAPNRFAITPESKRWNILNAQKLNFGNVDTRRKPRKYRIPKEDDYGTSQGQF